MDKSQLQILVIAFGLGLLVGLQREKTSSDIAGIRTFPLITVSGVLTALLAQHFGGWVLAAGFLAVTAILISASIIKQAQHYDAGITTEVSALVMYAVGAYLTIGNVSLALVIGAMVAVLLQMKDVLHSFVSKMGEHDLLAIMRFSAIALVVLPILPDQTYGPFNVLNPYDIWRMVVLIVGISLAGYAAYKVFKDSAGIILGGILGGLISSTATTVAYARTTKDSPESSSLATIAITLASTVSVARVTIAFIIIAPSAMMSFLPPLLLMLTAMVVISVISFFYGRSNSQRMPEQENPTELLSAVIFGVVYGAVIFAVAAAKEMLGQNSLYLVAIVSGFIDVDAITLSTARLVAANRLEPTMAWPLVLVAIIANLVFKIAAVAFLGNRSLLKKVALTLGGSCVAGLLLLFFMA